MACGCRGKGVTSSGVKIVGYDYIPPGGGASVRFLTAIEAKKEQRRNGGGTIYSATNP